jgi:hypothetical protein
LNIEIANRALEKLVFKINDNKVVSFKQPQTSLKKNTSITVKGVLKISENEKTTNPYYLEEEGSLGMYKVNDPNLIGLPETNVAFQVPLVLILESQKIEMSIPVIYKTSDPVRGEVYEPFFVVPKAVLQILHPVYVFQKGTPQEITISVTANSAIDKAQLKMELPYGWKGTPEQFDISNMQTGTTTVFTVNIMPGEKVEKGFLNPKLEIKGITYDQELLQIKYNHIPDQQLVRTATAKLVNPGLKNLAQTVAYINGAGDEVAQAIEAIGSKVFKFEPSEVPTDLSKYDAVVVGIRAFNVEPEAMANLQNRLDSYVDNGGTLVMQYNTDRGIPSDALGPLPISLSRKRVTDENAAITFLNPENKVLNSPNKITLTDFEGWVQERGLYFPEEWDPAFTPVLGMNDKDEGLTNGSLIVAEYGNGHVVYTGLSLFRELPAGVSGAYKLLANMISLSKNTSYLERQEN